MIELLADVVMPAVVAFIMFALGLGLRIPDFALALRRPVPLLAGLAAQMALLPAIAYAVVLAFGLTGEIALGVMILSVCPGGVTTTMFARLAGGRVALSVALTGIVTLLSAITLPAWLSLWFGVFLGDAAPAVELTALVLAMGAITVVPVLAGMALAHRWPDKVARVEPGTMRLAGILFWLFIAAGVVATWDIISGAFGTLGPALAVLVVALTGCGWLVGRALRLDPADRITLTIETGIQNGSIGIALVTLIYGMAGGEVPAAAVPIGLYSMLIYLLIVPLALGRRRRPAPLRPG